MDYQNKIFWFRIKCQLKNIFLFDVKRIVEAQHFVHVVAFENAKANFLTKYVKKKIINLPFAVLTYWMQTLRCI